MRTTDRIAACFAALLPLVTPSVGAVDGVRIDAPSIDEALRQPQSSLFWIERQGGKYHIGDSSHFAANLDFTHLTFDISNNQALANVGVQGQIKSLTIYRDSYRVASRPDRLPGVWVQKDNSNHGPYSYKLWLGDTLYDLATVDWDFHTGLLDNLFPLTVLRDPKGRFEVRLLTFAPLSQDGSQRLRGVVYGLHLRNLSHEALRGAVEVPQLWFDPKEPWPSRPWADFDPSEFEVAIGDSRPYQSKIAFDLKSSESLWLPVILSMPGEPVVAEVNRRGSLAWLQDSWRYYRGMLGRLEVPGDPYLAEFFERQLMQALQSVAMSPSGALSGTNWGSYPATRSVWLKDAFYSYLPLAVLEPALARKEILWFDEFGVRPTGNILPGGVSHSLSLSVASVVLAGVYYGQTGDKQFFLDHPGLREHYDSLLRQIISSRPDPSVWLFPSAYLSDGRLLCDFHTGSNVVAWRALASFARLLREVYDQPEPAKHYAAIADQVRAAIRAKATLHGPYGDQFIEGVHRDGHAPLMISDGEESDTTLMPFYGFLAYDDPVYLNYMRFSMSEHNGRYLPSAHAITWSGSPETPLENSVPSTAPGYVKGVALGNDRETLFGPHGFITEVRNVTDVDGSMWWWPFDASGDPRKWSYDSPVRGVPGKSGWFAGVYSAVFLSRFLGLTYDAPAGELRFAPLMPSTDQFFWNDFPMGNDRFSLRFQRTRTRVEAVFINHSRRYVKIESALPVDGLSGPLSKKIDEKDGGVAQTEMHLGHKTVRLAGAAAPGGTVRLSILGAADPNSHGK